MVERGLGLVYVYCVFFVCFLFSFVFVFFVFLFVFCLFELFCFCIFTTSMHAKTCFLAGIHFKSVTVPTRGRSTHALYVTRLVQSNAHICITHNLTHITEPAGRNINPGQVYILRLFIPATLFSQCHYPHSLTNSHLALPPHAATYSTSPYPPIKTPASAQRIPSSHLSTL